MTRSRFAATVLVLCAAGRLAAQPFDAAIESTMYKSPDLPTPVQVKVFPEGAKELWLKALDRPEADLRVQVAAAVARAHRQGIKGFDQFVAPLTVELERPDQHPAARLAIAEALIALDARQSAPSLFEQAQRHGGDLAELVEPALAKWDFAPMRAIWRERVQRAAAAPKPRDLRTTRELVLAIQGLATVGEARAADDLRTLVLAATAPGPVRLEAARALGKLRTEGLEKDVADLIADATPRGLVSRLAAVELLQRHQGGETIALLQRLAGDAEGAVAVRAVQRLAALDPTLVLLRTERYFTHAEPGVRLAVVAAIGQRPSAALMIPLAARLDDPHPDVRLAARRTLHDLAANKGLGSAVIDATFTVLGGADWRGLEQAVILLTQLDHKPAASRFVPLLRHSRPEVFVTAAWGLRRLALPETLPGALTYAAGRLSNLPPKKAQPARGQATLVLIDHQLSQLNQFFGQQNYKPAEPLLRRLVPRQDDPTLPETRAAAIWALGLLHAGKADADLTGQLLERLNDVGSIPPEDERVRLMCAITLGRMKATEAVPSLKAYYNGSEYTTSPINNGCGWALEQITGAKVGPPRTITSIQLDWFLVPHRPK
ncbi:MAG: HEAT repeat domain-containing protein [Gemmataceae bacterium]|nr:HEAT repeat domain-containing protein [Gemmataceae bacterium]